MAKFVILILLALLVWRGLTGRWPWQAKRRAAGGAWPTTLEAERLLGVAPGAGRLEIIAAHRRLVARIHPDKGGSGAQTQAANAARDVLLARLTTTKEL